MVFPHGGVIFTTSLQSLSLSLQPICYVSFHTEDNFLKAAVGKREETGKEKDSMLTESEEKFKKERDEFGVSARERKGETFTKREREINTTGGSGEEDGEDKRGSLNSEAKSNKKGT